ncbi:bifunctional 5,10-methylenetetrahydrofolate dehydrogenase/5,10-methenyltetrahydrofolate cyclohydrolase [Candidatus Saccharibacteria bacterium]|nr:bifunctional 5,10-methylenetetrahydrofolate dehydrogenase/5,10-methenyltetrahydrofolate cyclohydrolase [Candidatus Saccharibacteria bacterium]
MKILSGLELVGFIKERQAKQVRGLRQAQNVFPKLAIIQTKDDVVIDTYVRLKKAYGQDILVDVELYKVSQSQAKDTIQKLNQDDSVHGIIIQLPLEDTSETNELLNLVEPKKDVDGLGVEAILDAATPVAINWLIAGYNIELKNKQIVIVGNGRLVGQPLAVMWKNSGYAVTVVDSSTEDIKSEIQKADIVVTAAGSPGVVTSDMLRPDTVVIDAGVASEENKTVGDLASDVYERQDLALTPQKGGVGPLTVSALFDNVIRAARDLTNHTN